MRILPFASPLHGGGHLNPPSTSKPPLWLPEREKQKKKNRTRKCKRDWRTKQGSILSSPFASTGLPDFQNKTNHVIWPSSPSGCCLISQLTAKLLKCRAHTHCLHFLSTHPFLNTSLQPGSVLRLQKALAPGQPKFLLSASLTFSLSLASDTMATCSS